MRVIVASVSTKYGISTFISKKEKIVLREVANFCLENSECSASPIDQDMNDTEIIEQYFSGNEEDFINWDKVKVIKKLSPRFKHKKKKG